MTCKFISQFDVKCPLLVYFLRDFKTSVVPDFEWCTTLLDGWGVKIPSNCEY